MHLGIVASVNWWQAAGEILTLPSESVYLFETGDTVVRMYGGQLR